MGGKKQSGWLLIIWLFLAITAPGGAEDKEVAEHDELVYNDGDRLRGHLKQEANHVIVFVSDRFGELTVPSDKAVVIKGIKPEIVPEKVAPEKPAAKTAKAPVKAEPAPAPAAEAPVVHSKWYSPAMLTAMLHEYFNPWTGKFAFSTEVVDDTANRASVSVELTVKRKWKTDEVQIKGRYDFSRTSGKTTTDMFKTDGLWRHDFKKKGFVLYRPSLEWNQASFKSGVPSDYVQLQQEVGAGRTVYSSAKYKVRLGLSENLFDVWSITPGNPHVSRTSESGFLETEMKLPWAMLLTERGVIYYSFKTQDQGSENRIELTKRFSETLSAAVRHEMRRGSPDGRAQNYDRLKLLLGVDF